MHVGVIALGNALGNSIVSGLSKSTSDNNTQAKTKQNGASSLDPDTGKFSPITDPDAWSLNKALDRLRESDAKVEAGVLERLPAFEETITTPSRTKGWVNEDLIGYSLNQYFNENHSLSYSPVMTDYLPSGGQSKSSPVDGFNPNVNNSLWGQLSYGSSLLGVAVGLKEGVAEFTNRRTAFNEIGRLKSGLEGLESLFDNRVKPAVPSFESTKLSLLQKDIAFDGSIGRLSNLSGYKYTSSEWGISGPLSDRLSAYSKSLGYLGTVATVGEIGFDVAGAYNNGENVEAQFLASTTNAAIGATTAWASFKGGAFLGTATTGNPLIGLGVGTISAVAVSTGYNVDFSGDSSGSNAISSQVKDFLKSFFNDVSKAQTEANKYQRSQWGKPWGYWR